MIAWGITYVVHSSLFAAAVWIACRFIRSASARETLWKISLIAPLLTATLELTMPLRSVIPQATPARITLPADPVLVAPPANVEVQRTQTAPPLRASVDPRKIAIGFWIAGAALLLLRLLAGRLLFLRALRDRVELVREHDRLARLRAAMSCRPLVRLTESAAVGSPIALSQFISGWEIVVPRATFARFSDEQKETILAHELAHLVRRDPLWLLGGELVKALLFIQPLNWLAQKKMKECAEFLCDDIAVRQTSNPRALAETLAELATSVAPAPRAVAAMAEGGSNLMARVTRVLTMQHERPLRLATRVAIATIAVAVLAAFAPGMEKSLSKQGGAEGDINISDGVLSRTFDGPEGEMHTELSARDFELAQDASWFRFTSRNGFLRVSQTTTKGPSRQIDATPAGDLQPLIRYRVNGVEQPWNKNAQRLLLSAFQAEKAYAWEPADAIRVTPRQRHADPARNLKSWDANVELTGTRDHIPTAIRVRANGVRYDEATAEVFFDDGATLYVEETIGDDSRTFKRTSREMVWNGDFGQTEVSEWLAKILREQTKMPSNVAEAMGRK